VRNDLVLVLVVITALAFDFTNGFHDTGNAMATSIATGALPPRVAVALSGLLNLVGAFLSLAVAATIASGLVNTAEITLQVVAAGLAGGIIWNLLTWLLGIPSSSSHALIGGLIGSTLAAAGGSAVQWKGLVSKVIVPAALSPIIAAGVAAVGTWLLYRISRSLTRGARNHGFRVGQVGSACMVSLAHGTNDARRATQISRILVPVIAIRKLCPHPVNPAITIRVEQPAGKSACIFRDNDALPWLQLDFPHVLAARSVLREKARPMPGATDNFRAASLLLSTDFVARPQGAHGLFALAPEPRPGVRAHNTELPDVLVSRAGPAYAAISQVEAEEVCVVGSRFRRRRARRAPRAHGVGIGANRVLAPVMQRRP
jgi:Phosphate transporter family